MIIQEIIVNIIMNLETGKANGEKSPLNPQNISLIEEYNSKEYHCSLNYSSLHFSYQ